MPPNNRQRLDLITVLCRICASEEPNSIPIFGVEGKKQNIVKKIRACLPVDVREEDVFPKQICLTCLTKLDSFFEMHKACKEAQVKIEKKFFSLRRLENLEQSHVNVPIEEKLKKLTESYPVSYGTSAVICLAPEPTPPPQSTLPTITREPQVIPQAVAGGSNESVMAPVGYLTSATAPPAFPAAPSPANEEIYPQALIQVSQISGGEQPVIYQSRPVPVPVPAPAPATVSAPAQAQAPAPSPQPVPRRRLPVPKPMATQPSPQRTAPIAVKRQNGEAPDGPQAKKLCRYCNKWFTDDIIDHHISLHQRQTFRTCLDCNKNFRSEEAFERHRCGTNETIDLDADDEEPIVL